MSEGEKCSSSPVCQIVVPELYCDLVWKVSEGEKCSSSSVCHLVVTESCCDLILTQQDSVTTRRQTDEEEHFSPSDVITSRREVDTIKLNIVLFFISLPPSFENIAR